MFATCSDVWWEGTRDKREFFAHKRTIFHLGGSTHRDSLGQVWGVAQAAEDACRRAEGMLGRWRQGTANHGRRNICAQSLLQVAAVSGLEPVQVFTATYTGRTQRL
jgi:hypothetical protein